VLIINKVCGRRPYEHRNGAPSKIAFIRRYVALFLGALASVGCTAERDRLDAEVRRLCAIEGGVKVYERVGLPRERFGKYGGLSVPGRGQAKAADEFVYDIRQEYLVRGNPEMWRLQITLIRQKDQKVLGESVSYTRRGGDFPGLWQPSHFSCPDSSGTSLERSVFFKTST